MTAAWAAPNSSGTGVSYSLGPTGYSADTSALATPFAYVTSEIIGGIVLAPTAQCVPGSYRLLGYSTSTTSFLDASDNVLVAAVAFTGLTTDRWVIVKNENVPPSTHNRDAGRQEDNHRRHGTFSFTRRPD